MIILPKVIPPESKDESLLWNTLTKVLYKRLCAKYIIISYDKVVDITTNEYQAWARNHVKTFNLWTYLVILTNSWRLYQMPSTFPPPHNTHHHNHLPTSTLHSPRVQTSQPTVNILFVKYISTSTKFVQSCVSWTKVNKDKQR